jgi:endonuclease I
MLKRIYLLIAAACLLSIGVLAQIPSGYYNTASGKTGNELKAALYEIIKGHTELTYTPGLWNAFAYTDKRSDGKVWDMYSACDFTFVTDQDPGSGGTSECQYYNREHSFPREWFGGAIAPMNTDLFHIYPTDKKVNSVRASYPFGSVGNASYTSGNGSKLGTSNYPGYTSTVFEPIDEYKGDFARSYFYMATRYHNIIQNWSSPMLAGNQYPAFTSWAVSILLEWNTNDPVSEKEINRNNVIHTSYQHNRNPYIDHPEYAQLVWNPNGTNVTITNIAQISVYPNPASETINVTLSYAGVSNYYVADISGRIVLNGELNHENSTGTISLNGLSEGIYFLRIIGNNQIGVVRFVVGK